MNRRAAHRAAVLAPLLAGAALVFACATDASLVGPGGECFLASDCQPGLVCIEQRDKRRVCTDDLTGVEGRPPQQGEAGEAGEPAEGGADGPVPPVDGGQDTGTQDTGAQDTGVDTGMDAPADG